MSAKSLVTKVWVVFGATTSALTEAIDRINKKLLRWTVSVGMSLWGMAYGIRIISSQMRELREAWVEAWVEMEKSTIRLNAVLGMSEEELGRLLPIVEDLKETKLWSTADIQLGMAYLRQIRLTSDQINELKNILLERGYDEKKVSENLASEILDVCLIDAINRCGVNKVCEININGKDVNSIVEEILEYLHGVKKCEIGIVDWLSELEKENKLDEYLNF